MTMPIFLIPFFFAASLQANIQDDRAELMNAERELFIAKKQVVLLKEQYEAEKQKLFNYSRTKAYEKMIAEYQEKAKRWIWNLTVVRF